MKITEEHFIEQMRIIMELEEETTLQMSSILDEYEEWDSLVALTFLAMAKQHYGVDLGGEDIRESSTVQDFYQRIEAAQS